MNSKSRTLFTAPLIAATVLLGLLNSSIATASPGDVWSLSGDWSLVSNPAPPVDPGVAGGGTGTWSYHSGGAPDFFGVPGPVNLYGLTSSGDISALVNGELPDQGDVWQHQVGNHIVLGKYTVASVSPPDNTDYLSGNVGGHADTGATWTTDHAGTFLVEYLGYNARALNAGGLVNMDLIDPAGPTLLKRTILDPGAPGNSPGEFQGIANAEHESTILTLPAGEGIRYVMSNNDWSGLDMTITELFAGDFDADGDVDAADRMQWEGDFGANGSSDADYDGDSDGADFVIWQRNFTGPMGSLVASVEVPEPSALLLIGVCCSFACCMRVKKLH